MRLESGAVRLMQDRRAEFGQGEQAKRPLAVVVEDTDIVGLTGAGPVTACPDCGRIYWPGSHVRRMRARLDCWRRGDLMCVGRRSVAQ